MGKIGLVLEGGAMRGMFTAGVLDAFLEKDIPFDGIIGVSAGALANRHAVYNRAVEELAQWEQQGRAFVVRPSRPLTIHRMERDPDKLQAVYALGLADARAALPRLGDYLGSV